MKRDVQPELLDQLPINDPRARRSRSDIRRLSRLAGAPGWWVRTLRPFVQPDMKLLEIGAGEGHLATRLRATFPQLQVDALDVCPKPADWPDDARWWQCDAREFTGYAVYDIVVANFLLHQFSDNDLRKLGGRLQRGPRLLAFFEPVRRQDILWGFPLLVRTLGMNRITLHDGQASIRAGFVRDELPTALNLGPGWRLHTRSRLRGGYTMVADQMMEEGLVGEALMPNLA